MDMEGYKAVRAAAPHWLQIAMDLAIQTLQRREDVVNMRYDDVTDNILHVRQRKTDRKLRVVVSPELQSIIGASRDHETGPYIVHYEPHRTPLRTKGRNHPMQVTSYALSHAFTCARRRSGYYDHTSQPPTFHDIRNLGADTYRAAGWTESQVQTLCGNSDVPMIHRYLASHGLIY